MVRGFWKQRIRPRCLRLGLGVVLPDYFVMICRVAIKRDCMMVRGVCVRYGRLRYHMLFRKSPRS